MSTNPQEHQVPEEYLTILETVAKRLPESQQRWLEELETARKRETELEALYVEGRATEAQLGDLEQVRMLIEDLHGLLDESGYFDTH